MTMRTGFTLIEILIAVVIASLISLTLFQFFYQSQLSVRRVESLLMYTENIPLVYHQLEKDISCAFVPQQALAVADQTSTSTAAPVPTTSQQGKQQPPPKEEDKKKLEDVFVAKQEKEITSFMTFIATNPLLGYEEQAPRVIRIVYRLEEIPGERRQYKLLRQEVADLSFEHLEKEKKESIMLMDTITAWKCSFIVEKKSDAEKDEKSKKEYETFATWDTKLSKKLKRVVPDFIEIKGAYWDTQRSREQTFTFTYRIQAQEYQTQRKLTSTTIPIQAPPVSSVPQPGGKALPAIPAPGQKQTLTIIKGGP